MKIDQQAIELKVESIARLESGDFYEIGVSVLTYSPSRKKVEARSVTWPRILLTKNHSVEASDGYKMVGDLKKGDIFISRLNLMTT